MSAMSAALASSSFSRTLQMLQGASSRSSSPIRSPRLASPAKTPRAVSPSRSMRTSCTGGCATPMLEEGISLALATSPACTRASSRLCSEAGFAGGSEDLPARSSGSFSKAPLSPRPCSRNGAASPRVASIRSDARACSSPSKSSSVASSILDMDGVPGVGTPATAAPAPAAGLDSPPASPATMHPQVVKILARIGGDSLRTMLFLQSPLDGVASVVADTASEVVLKQVASTTGAPVMLEPGATAAALPVPVGPAAAAAGPPSTAVAAATPGKPPEPPVNPVYANALSVVVSTLLSGAAHAAIDVPPLLPQAPPTPTPTEVSHSANSSNGGGAHASDLTPAQRLAMRLSSVSIAAALAKAPPLRAADAEDAFGVGAVAATTGIKMLLHPGSIGTSVPDLGGMFEGLLSTVGDSYAELGLTSPGVLLQQPMAAGPWGGHIPLPTPKP